MSFIVDSQTLRDLGISSHNREKSIVALYDSTHTRGGAALLKEMFANPTDNVALIRRRSAVISFFMEGGVRFAFDSAAFDSAEYYLSETDERTRLTMEDRSLWGKLWRLYHPDGARELLVAGQRALIQVIAQLHGFVETLSGNERLAGEMPELQRINEIYASQGFREVLALAHVRKISSADIVRMDDFLRFSHAGEVRCLMEFVYRMDVYMSVARTAGERGFTIARMAGEGSEILRIQGLFHPLLASPVKNDVDISEENNVVFLTGANMAGKSTFMKSLGIAVYLAHLGFPVPADGMEFSVRDGLFTTINLPDSIDKGYSHFYAEVRRLRRVASMVASHPRLLIIFDELFRGTNVKDAFDATVAVTEAFSALHSCLFVISTHIVEAGDELRTRCANIEYLYLPTEMDGETPRYTYRLRKGITADRHGMLLVRNAGILELLNG